MIILTLTFLLAFLCGSIPTGYLIIKKLYGIDIRTTGSKNIGSTNVKRLAGTKISIITQTIDVLKGLLPVLIGMYISKIIELPITQATYVSIIAIAVILGHDYTPFLNFNGGKGVNTTLGAFFLIAPLPTISGVIFHLILGKFTSIVSMRSIILGATIPIMSIIMNLQFSIIISSTIAFLLIIFRHKDNLIRIINHQEN